MPIKQIARDTQSKIAAARGALARKAEALTRRARYRLASRIVRKRRFWLLVLIRTWVFPLAIVLVIQAPLRAPAWPRLSLAVKVSTSVLLAMQAADAYMGSRRRWRRLTSSPS